MGKGKAGLVFCALLLLCGCIGGDDAKKISLEEKIYPEALYLKTQHGDDEIKIAVAGVISPKESFVYYEELLAYVSERLGRPVKLVQRETYQEINDLVKYGHVDAAFVCSGAYVEGHDKFGMELLVAPVAYGEPVYYSYIIVPSDSYIMQFEDLRGKKFAFSDPMSNTGKLAPTYMLAEINETPASFFDMYIFTYNHDKSIEAVAEKLVEGAAVDSLIWDYLNETRPELTSKTRIIKKSQPFGIPPVVVPSNLDPELKEELKEIFLHMYEDERGKEILSKIKIDLFIEVEDSHYNSIRKMKERTK
jgi:phosphonate transport system substrate-binding protein